MFIFTSWGASTRLKFFSFHNLIAGRFHLWNDFHVRFWIWPSYAMAKHTWATNLTQTNHDWSFLGENNDKDVILLVRTDIRHLLSSHMVYWAVVPETWDKQVKVIDNAFGKSERACTWIIAAGSLETAQEVAQSSSPLFATAPSHSNTCNINSILTRTSAQESVMLSLVYLPLSSTDRWK